MSKKNFKNVRGTKKMLVYGVNKGMGAFREMPKRMPVVIHFPQNERQPANSK